MCMKHKTVYLYLINQTLFIINTMFLIIYLSIKHIYYKHNILSSLFQMLIVNAYTVGLTNDSSMFTIIPFG